MKNKTLLKRLKLKTNLYILRDILLCKTEKKGSTVNFLFINCLARRIKQPFLVDNIHSVKRSEKSYLSNFASVKQCKYLEVIGFVQKLVRIVNESLLINRLPLVVTGLKFDLQMTFLLTFVVRDVEGVLKVQAIRQGLEEQVGRSDQDVFSGLPERVLFLGDV